GTVANPGLAALVSRPGQDTGEQHASRAVELLRQAVRAGHRHVAGWQSDPDLAVLASRPAVQDLRGQSGALRGDHSGWRGDTTREAVGLYGLAPQQHLARCRELTAQGYRPVALSLGTVVGEQGAVAASVWHGPALPEAEKDGLAKWQGVAAATLLAQGQAEGL